MAKRGTHLSGWLVRVKDSGDYYHANVCRICLKTKGSKPREDCPQEHKDHYQKMMLRAQKKREIRLALTAGQPKVKRVGNYMNGFNAGIGKWLKQHKNKWMWKNGRKYCPTCLRSADSNPRPDCPDYHKSHAKKVRDHVKEWRMVNRERYNASKKRRDAWVYGLTEEKIEEMIRAQNGKCAICKRDITGTISVKNPRWTVISQRRKSKVDHDHRTGAIRGLLCNKCNFMIGYADEDTKVLASAIRYLNSWNNHDYIPQVKLDELQ